MEDEDALKLNRSLGLFWAAFFVFTLVSTFLVSPAKADVPNIVSLFVDVRAGEIFSPEPDAFLIIEIRHASSSSDDYVDKVEINKDGVVTEFAAPSREAQSTEVFSMSVSIGKEEDVTSAKPTFEVRAHSTVDGWGAWSDSFVIPEFSGISIIFVFVACIGIIVLLKRVYGRALTGSARPNQNVSPSFMESSYEFLWRMRTR